jgi:hypothetical protein
MEASMTRITRLVALVAGLILLLNVTPSWGQIENPVVATRGSILPAYTRAFKIDLTRWLPQRRSNTVRLFSRSIAG